MADPANPWTLPQKDKLLEAMKKNNVTSEWDVLVSYSVTNLLDAVSKLWISKNTSIEVPMHFDFPPVGFRQTLSLTLGSPTLSFIAGERGMARLTMSLNGWSRNDTLKIDHKTKQVTVIEAPKDSETIIEKGYYELRVDVSLKSVKGDAKATDPSAYMDSDRHIVFGELNTNVCKVVFHFQAEGSLYSVRKTAAHPEEIEFDQTMQQAAEEIRTWFKASSGFSSLDYALATVEQRKATGDAADILYPESFIFRTQGSDPNHRGHLDPAFKPENQELLSIPQGYTASVIIRREIFLERYLTPLLTTQCGGPGVLNSVELDNNFKTGFLYNLRISPKALVNRNPAIGRGPWNDGNLKIVCDFGWNDPPLTLKIENGQAQWSWDFQDNRHDWSTWNNSGRAYFDTTSIASVSDKDIAMKADLNKDDFNLWIHPYNGNFLEKWRSGWSDSLPRQFEGCYMDLSGLSMSNHNFTFFATTNVFAPGKRIINIDSSQGLFNPYDVMLVGHVNESPDSGGSFNNAGADDATAGSPDALKTTLFQDQDFLAKFYSAIRDGKTVDTLQAIDDTEIQISNEDIQILKDQASSGPSFDIRLAGGLYKIDTPDTLSKINVSISPMDGMISLDNHHVQSQTVDDATGQVQWTLGGNTYKVKFSTEFDTSGNVAAIKFDGETWPTEDLTKKVPFQGHKTIPSSDTSFSDSGGWFGSAAAQGISFTIACLGLTGLSLASVWKKIQEHRRDSAKAEQAVHEAQSRAQEISAAAEAGARSAPRSSQVLRSEARIVARQGSNMAVESESGFSAVGSQVDAAVLEVSSQLVEMALISRNGRSMSLLPGDGEPLVADIANQAANEAFPPKERQDLVSAANRVAEASKAIEDSIEKRKEALKKEKKLSDLVQTTRSELEQKRKDLNELQKQTGVGQPDRTAELAELEKRIKEQERKLAEVGAEHDAAEKEKIEAEAANDKAAEEQEEAAKEEKEAAERGPEHGPEPPKI
ncbi:hypothetical protein LTR70_001432 [Exophiala xenobiotica]|uniref:Uncharacterized protein n=1 Tax=Lithohypha guttulata TaxID=1690604 RepID=A0ABR0KM58_9EURO|nr:hypothetical protein LTR24_000814 [Lithohypha guttulata]KAK5328111.1 hypothetical protein LTR70_001432 [Exophiala xenobiotica]